MIYAKYTEVLKNLLDNPQTKELIDKAMSTYELYEQRTKGEYIPIHIPTRQELNDAILNYYKYREIGFETVGRFLDELETALKEIMPYYNQMFISVDQDYNILENANYTREITRDRDVTNVNKLIGSETGSSNSEGSDKNTTSGQTSSTANDTSTTQATTQHYGKGVESQTPQSELSISNTNIDSVNYADKATWGHDTNTDNATSTGQSTTSGTSSTTSNGTSTQETTTESNNQVDSNGETNEDERSFEHTKGNYGVITYQMLIEKYRENIINVTQMIINDKRIQELFMLVY